MSQHANGTLAARNASMARASKKRRLEEGWVRIDMIVPSDDHRKAIQGYARALRQTKEGVGITPELPESLVAELRTGLSEQAADILQRVASLLRRADATVLTRLVRRVSLSEDDAKAAGL